MPIPKAAAAEGQQQLWSPVCKVLLPDCLFVSACLRVCLPVCLTACTFAYPTPSLLPPSTPPTLPHRPTTRQSSCWLSWTWPCVPTSATVAQDTAQGRKLMRTAAIPNINEQSCKWTDKLLLLPPGKSALEIWTGCVLVSLESAPAKRQQLPLTKCKSQRLAAKQMPQPSATTEGTTCYSQPLTATAFDFDFWPGQLTQ